MKDDKKIIIPFSVTANNSFGVGVPMVPPVLIDKMGILDDDIVVRGDKKEYRK